MLKTPGKYLGWLGLGEKNFEHMFSTIEIVLRPSSVDAEV